MCVCTNCSRPKRPRNKKCISKQKQKTFHPLSTTIIATHFLSLCIICMVVALLLEQHLNSFALARAFCDNREYIYVHSVCKCDDMHLTTHQVHAYNNIVGDHSFQPDEDKNTSSARIFCFLSGDFIPFKLCTPTPVEPLVQTEQKKCVVGIFANLARIQVASRGRRCFAVGIQCWCIIVFYVHWRSAEALREPGRTNFSQLISAM